MTERLSLGRTAIVPLRRSGLPFMGVLTSILLLTFAGGHAQAQVLFGTMVGSVTDPSGAAIPQATVKVIESSTNDSRTAQTNDSGGYTISTVPPGTYQIEITKSGFRGF